jgi:hypothetical protein
MTRRAPHGDEQCVQSASLEDWWAKWAVALLLLIHAVASVICYWPSLFPRVDALAHRDYPLHAHHAYVHREAFWESGFTFGYEPALCGGCTLQPPADTSGTIYQFVAIVLPWLNPARVVIDCALCIVVVSPFLLALATRMFGMSWEEVAWGLMIAVALFWFAIPYRLLLEDGMTTFLASTYVGFFVLAVYQRFLTSPNLWRFIGATAAASLLMFIHILGPVAILLPLIVLVVGMPGVPWRWRLAAAASPLIIAAINSFWLVRIPLQWATPPTPWSSLDIGLPLSAWTWDSWVASKYLGGAVWAAHVIALPIGIAGLIRLVRRRCLASAISIGLVLATSLLLFTVGSYWHLTRHLEPVRFMVVFWTALAILGGCSIAGLRERLRVPGLAALGIYVTGAVGIAVAFAFFGPSIHNGRDALPLVEFLRSRTNETDRLLIQAHGRYGRITQDLPRAVRREVIGSKFPDARDPLQFAGRILFGQQVSEMTPERAYRMIDQFGVNWVFVRTSEWRQFFRSLTGSNGEEVGSFLAFQVSQDRSRFLIGSGEITAKVNRFELRNVEPTAGRVVLKYRYHPGWVCDPPASVEQFPIVDHPAGLLLIRNPSQQMTLRFDPWRSLKQPWPAPGSSGPSLLADGSPSAGSSPAGQALGRPVAQQPTSPP